MLEIIYDNFPYCRIFGINLWYYDVFKIKPQQRSYLLALFLNKYHLDLKYLITVSFCF